MMMNSSILACDSSHSLLSRRKITFTEALRQEPQILKFNDDVDDDDATVTCSINTSLSQSTGMPSCQESNNGTIEDDDDDEEEDTDLNDVRHFLRLSRILKANRLELIRKSTGGDSTVESENNNKKNSSSHHPTARRIRFAEPLQHVHVIAPVPRRYHVQYYTQPYEIRRSAEHALTLIYLVESDEMGISRFRSSGYDNLRGLEDMVDGKHRRRATRVHWNNVLEAQQQHNGDATEEGDKDEMMRMASLQKSAYHQQCAIQRGRLDAQECIRVWSESYASEKTSKSKRGLRGMLAKMKLHA
jgi:hypothetical protein